MMFFTFCGRIVAVLAVFLGVFRIALGLLIAGMEGPAQEAAIANYFGAGTTGENIDQAFYVVFIGIALGILTEISYTLRRAGSLAPKSSHLESPPSG